MRWDNIQDVVLDYRVHSLASQRRLLGYAEVAGYALREFLLKKTIINFLAVVFSSLKAFLRPDRQKGKF